MKNKLLGLLLLFVASSASAGTCETSLMPLFTAAQATKLCQSFGSAINSSLIPATTATYDLGSSSKKWRDAYLSRNVTIGGTLGVTGASTLTGAVAFTGGGSITGTGSLQLNIASGAGITLRDSEMTLGASNYQIVPGNSTVAIRNAGDTTNEFLFSAGGGFSNVGTITSSRATDLGWAVVNAANQACNTTCVSACVVGLDAGASAFLACTDATADSCLCAGAS